jgi:RNA polymerase sigma-70 factor (sigma-E family)
LFEDFVAARGQALQRFGYALTGDWALAEDLLQTALARAYPRWPRAQRDDPDAYVRKIMLNTWASWRRRRWRGEVPAVMVPDLPGPDSFAAVDHRQALRLALAKLPPRQRAVVVLRYHQDLSERQVAELLAISVGTVKSQAARALAALRAEAALAAYSSQIPADGDRSGNGGVT